jgi:uncharacterized membrane protein YphA (DoxX/SURF4 family)
MRPALKWTLVILRLAIGWHFLFEGLDKLRSLSLGPTEFNRPWTSATFLREAPGPAGPWLRRLAGEDADWFDSINWPIAGYVKAPTLVFAPEWPAYRDRFISHYRVDQDPEIRSRVDTAYQAAVARAVDWLLVPKTQRQGSVRSTFDQIKAYQRLQARIKEMQEQEFPAFGHDVRHAQLREARTEARRLAAGWKAAWSKQTEDMHKDLELCLDESRRALGPLPDGDRAERIDRLDRLIAWGLTVIGGCILLGLMTRPTCLLAACFLALIYLTYPPWPSMPDNLDGRNIFVDQNLIEMLALLVLAMVPSGRWLGLDALIFMPWRRKSLAPARAPGIGPS